MDKDLKQMNHAKQYSCSSKRIVALSFVAAVQVSSCASGRGQGLIPHSLVLDQYIDLSRVSKDVPGFKELQAKTATTVLEQFAKPNAELAKSHAQIAFSQAIKKCDLPSVKSLLKHPCITSKEVVTALMLALKYEDTLSFRYKHDKIVDFY